jgi:hypothetical protein
MEKKTQDTHQNNGYDNYNPVKKIHCCPSARLPGYFSKFRNLRLL